MKNKYEVIDVERKVYPDSINSLYIIKDKYTSERFSCHINDNIDGEHNYIKYIDEDVNIFDLIEALVEYDASIYEILDKRNINSSIKKTYQKSLDKRKKMVI